MRKPAEYAAEKIFLLAAVVSAAITILIFGFMVTLGLPLFKLGHLVTLLTHPWSPDQNSYGIYPMIIGTLSIGFISLAVAFPLSLGAATLISVIQPEGFGRILKKTVQLMTGIPTVIYGFVGIFLLVPLIRKIFDGGSGRCILSASIMLAVLISPTMILFFVDSFEGVPKSYLDAVEALGAGQAQKFLHVIFPCAWPGILTGLILALGRATGDTLIALMIAGNAVAVPGSILDSARTLTAHIALIIAADFESLEFKTLFACGIILYIFTMTIVLTVRLLVSINRKKNESTGGR